MYIVDSDNVRSLWIRQQYDIFHRLRVRSERKNRHILWTTTYTSYTPRGTRDRSILRISRTACQGYEFEFLKKKTILQLTFFPFLGMYVRCVAYLFVVPLCNACCW